MIFLCTVGKIIYSKYSKHWPDTVAHSIDCFRSHETCRFLLEIKAILLETSLFLSAQMAVLSSFFQMFIELGMYNFDSRVDIVCYAMHYFVFQPHYVRWWLCMNSEAAEAFALHNWVKLFLVEQSTSILCIYVRLSQNIHTFFSWHFEMTKTSRLDLTSAV